MFSQLLRPQVFGLLALGALGACQTAPHAPSGFLSSYDGIAPPGRSLRAAVNQRRDDAAVAAIDRVYISPAVLTADAADRIPQREQQVILREVDRRICFAVSRRFAVLDAPAADAAVLRTAVVEIRPTGRLGSAVSAAAGFVNPIPLTNIRVPRTTGGLAVESELIGPDGSQLAAVTWARNANVIGRDDPSLSRIGDAIQMTRPMGSAVGRAFTPEARQTRPVADPDPCGQYGPRRNIPRWIADKAFGYFTGLYAPEVAGLARPLATDTEAATPSQE